MEKKSKGEMEEEGKRDGGWGKGKYCHFIVTHAVSLHCALASCGAVYCNRSCLWVCFVCMCVCVFVGLLPP